MENFIVSARKYRPDTFESVVGQRSITTTLQNAIKANKLAHAYLFCGPRGVGKTTCARIFAQTINCQNRTSETEACGECESCKAFQSSRSYNIHELDAASNNSVEDIRNLIDQVRIPPQIGKYSVYIIDEVHMLSSAAFNAFLKTLEEPPPHARFILATTEKHKILPTILSRCQIFDFNRIKVQDIADHLQTIAKREGFNAEPEALNVVAQKADGGLRDALSFFDQIASFSGTDITYDKVIENLNVLDYEYYFKLTDNFLEGNYTESLITYNEILNRGFDSLNFINGLSEHFRDLLVSKEPKTLELLEIGASIKERYKIQSKKASVAFLYQALMITSQCDVQYKMAKNKRLLVELNLMKLNNILQFIQKQNAENVQLQPVQKQVVNNNTTETTTATTEEAVKKPVIEKKSNSFSIKDAMNTKVKPTTKKKNVVEEKTATYETTANKELIESEVKAKWLEFAEQKKNEPRLYSSLKTYIPTIKEKNTLILAIINQSQKDILEKLRGEVLSFLKTELQNSNIELIITIAEQATKSTRPYSNNDKYLYLKEINPTLTKLQKTFNLDF